MSITAMGRRLREERLRLGMSQTDFGALANVSLGSQQHYEMGRRSPDAGYLFAIIRRGVDVLYVLTGIRMPEIWRDQITRVLRTTAEVEPEGGRLTELALRGIAGLVAEPPAEYGDLSADERQLLALFRRADLSHKMRAVAVLDGVRDPETLKENSESVRKNFRDGDEESMA